MLCYRFSRCHDHDDYASYKLSVSLLSIEYLHSFTLVLSQTLPLIL